MTSLSFKDVSFLTLKNPSNNLNKEELMRVLFHLKDICKFGTIHHLWYERGKQDQQHIHAIIRKQYPDDTQLAQYSKSFKLRKLRYLTYKAEAEEHNENGLGDMLEYEIDTKTCNFHISKFEHQVHLADTINEYQFKECFVDFVE